MRHKLAAFSPRHHLHQQDDGDDEWEPTTLWNFRNVCTEEGHINDRQWRTYGQGFELGPLPAIDRKYVEQDGGDRHCRCHSDAVGGSKVGRGFKGDDESDTAKHQQPIHERYINLPTMI